MIANTNDCIIKRYQIEVILFGSLETTPEIPGEPFILESYRTFLYGQLYHSRRYPGSIL
jgi:hypothetical protein